MHAVETQPAITMQQIRWRIKCRVRSFWNAISASYLVLAYSCNLWILLQQLVGNQVKTSVNGHYARNPLELMENIMLYYYTYAALSFRQFRVGAIVTWVARCHEEESGVPCGVISQSSILLK
jgi:hypothetical protein